MKTLSNFVSKYTKFVSSLDYPTIFTFLYLLVTNIIPIIIIILTLIDTIYFILTS